MGAIRNNNGDVNMNEQVKNFLTKYGTLGAGVVVIAAFVLWYFGLIDTDTLLALLGTQ